jgi:methylthioribulose-1-phosphate dehydratase
MTMTAATDAIRGRALAGVEALRDIGALFYQRGWSVGTSSNYSIVLDKEPLRLLLTASGKDKRRLAATDFVVVDAEGQCLEPGAERPSAETALHVMLGRWPGVGAVLHTHSVWSTLLSDLYSEAGGFWIEGYEMLKGLAGVSTHEHRLWVPIFPNSQDIPALARQVSFAWDEPEHPLRHGFLLRKHGLYTWGRDIEEARRHIEIFEFLFEVVARRLQFPAGGLPA